MSYILIVMWMGMSSSYSGKAAISVEFNSLKSCLAAADALKRQDNRGGSEIGAILCAAKGKP
jgi:hypothetical protein